LRSFESTEVAGKLSRLRNMAHLLNMFAHWQDFQSFGRLLSDAISSYLVMFCVIDL